VDKLDLKGNIKALKEWNEGYEDLEAIQFSFVVEFRQDRQYWSLYADSEEDKVRSLLIHDVFIETSAVQTLGTIQSRWRAVIDW
jgi:hypothetical protein